MPSLPGIPQIHLDYVNRKTRRILRRAAGTSCGFVPILRHDGTRIGAVVPAEVADILEEALAGVRIPALLRGQADPVARAALASISGRLRDQYGDR